MSYTVLNSHVLELKREDDDDGSDLRIQGRITAE